MTPVAAPPTTVTASSGTSAAHRLRKTSTFTRTIRPSISMPTMRWVGSSASRVSTWSARPPVNPVRRRTSAKASSACSRNARNRLCMPGSTVFPSRRTDSRVKARSGAVMLTWTSGVCE